MRYVTFYYDLLGEHVADLHVHDAKKFKMCTGIAVKVESEEV